MTTTPPTARGLASRERMLDAAITLMRHSGLSGAGINEVVKASAAPKGSVYHFFPGGKRQLASEALALHAGRVLGVIDAAMARGRTPGARVRALLRAFARRLDAAECRQSCALGAVALDLDDELEPVRAAIEQSFDAWIERIASHLGFADARRARSFAGLLLTAIEGAYVRGRAGHTSRAFIEAGDWLGALADREAALR
jgi:TetR/AcrR family transcriptional repressor of lmrAB and yxaGH operons